MAKNLHPFIPPFVPPQAGGEEAADKFGGKHLLHSFLRERMFYCTFPTSIWSGRRCLYVYCTCRYSPPGAG